VSKTFSVIVPLTPPSVNHYMKHRVATINGIATVVVYPSKDAKAWWRAVGICAGGRSLQADGFEIAYVVYQGSNERGDVDNYGKCILDSIVRAGVIDSDHKVTALHAYKVRDRANPRTEIFIRPVGQLALLEAPMPAKDDW
jgi:Holliday junction resolvase RusA-like endonuclease